MVNWLQVRLAGIRISMSYQNMGITHSTMDQVYHQVVVQVQHI